MFALLFRSFARVPLPLLHRLGAGFGCLVVLLSPGYRRHLRANLEQAGYHDRKLLWRAAAEAGKGVLELPFVWSRPQADVLARTTTSRWELLDAIRAEVGDDPKIWLPIFHRRTAARRAQVKTELRA